MKVKKYGYKNWGVYEDGGKLICVTLSKRGATKVAKRLKGKPLGMVAGSTCRSSELHVVKGITAHHK